MDVKPLALDGATLTLEGLEAVCGESGRPVGLAADARGRVERAREVVDRAVRENRVVYGLTTGFGRLAETVISSDRLEELQLNLIRSHACGVGRPLSRAETRAVTLLRANVLAKGHSGIRAGGDRPAPRAAEPRASTR
jgi:histidine ammonia-lyase